MMKITILLLPMLIMGCANPYRANFNSTKEQYPAWLEARFSPKTGQPQLILSDDVQAGNWRLLEKGYLMIGFSKFDGPQIDVDLAVKEGRRVGADVVLVQRKFTKSLTETVTVTQWPPSETTEIREDTDVSGGKGTRQINRRVEITTSKGPETVFVPKQVDYYEHAATFWRKIERPIFGAVVRDLSDDQKQKLQTNRGLVVRNIIADSPAFEADLLKGDILLKIDGEPVPTARRFYEDIITLAGKQVTLTILRSDKKIDKKLTFNP